MQEQSQTLFDIYWQDTASSNSSQQIFIQSHYVATIVLDPGDTAVKRKDDDIVLFKDSRMCVCYKRRSAPEARDSRIC